MIYKITLDSNLMSEEFKVPGMDTLKRWQDEGKIDLLEANRPKAPEPLAYGWPGAPPKPAKIDKKRQVQANRSGKIAASGNANFRSIAAVLFPTKSSQKLNMNEVNSVAHLIKHHSNKNDVFITTNTDTFITAGRRETLLNSFGITVMTPDEAIEMLKKLRPWADENKSAQSG